MNQPNIRIGEGWDSHRLVPDRPLILGGVTIPHTHGLFGHSDADALCHAITDALFGAAAMGDDTGFGRAEYFDHACAEACLHRGGQLAA